MPRIVREATLTWRGTLSRGSGVAVAGTGAFELPVDLPSRVGAAGEVDKTSPEELLAAAHATCYGTSLAGEIARAGGTVDSLAVRCVITMDEVESGGHRIVASDVDVDVRADGISQEDLDEAARVADEGCPFSALLRASASVSVRAELAT
jgi:lipoyl-dependent peroxiredoxin